MMLSGITGTQGRGRGAGFTEEVLGSRPYIMEGITVAGEATGGGAKVGILVAPTGSS